MGINIELMEQLKEAVSSIKTIAEALKINPDGSIDVNSLNFVDSIAIKDGINPNQKAIVDANGRLLVDTNLSISPNSIIIDPDNQNYKAKVDPNGRLLVSAAAGGTGLIGSVKLEDANDSNKKVYVDASGRLLVALPPPSPPAGTTEVKQTEFNDVGGNRADYDYYLIPAGETLRIQKLLGSSEDRSKETYVALWLDNNGDTPSFSQKDGHPNWNLISMAFTNISNVNFDLNEEIIGDGIKRIVLHRRRMDAGSRLVFARWQGYY
jgi:hypothetical protein